MLDNKNLLGLMKAAAKVNSASPVAYSFNGENLQGDAINEVLRNEMRELAGTYALYRENKNTIFSLIEQTIEDVLPETMVQKYGDFAEFKTFKQGDKPIFRHKLKGNQRAKQFITRVGLAGMYEVFKLDAKEENFEVKTSAIGGAAQIGFEEFLDGRVDFAELTQIVMDGLDELIFEEIGKALESGVKQLPASNKRSQSGFDEAQFDKLMVKAAAYGNPTIYCTYEFAVKMLPQESWQYSENMKNELWSKGYFQNYKGRQVVILPQGFTDESLTKKAINPAMCYIMPSGADTKPIKVAMEGETIVDEFNNYDRSREIQVYKKIGVAAMFTNDIFMYEDTALVTDADTWNLNGAKAVTTTVLHV